MVKANVKKKSVSNANRQRRIIIWVTAALLIVIGGYTAWSVFEGSSSEVVAVANQFKPDSSWELKAESIQGSRKICIDVECPSVWRQWKTDNLVSKDELSQNLHASGWNFEIEGDCVLDPADKVEDKKVCSASGTADGYTVLVTIRSSNSPKHSLVGLNTWKE